MIKQECRQYKCGSESEEYFPGPSATRLKFLHCLSRFRLLLLISYYISKPDNILSFIYDTHISFIYDTHIFPSFMIHINGVDRPNDNMFTEPAFKRAVATAA